jgi:hypothetical protein
VGVCRRGEGRGGVCVHVRLGVVVCVCVRGVACRGALALFVCVFT